MFGITRIFGTLGGRSIDTAALQRINNSQRHRDSHLRSDSLEPGFGVGRRRPSFIGIVAVQHPLHDDEDAAGIAATWITKAMGWPRRHATVRRTDRRSRSFTAGRAHG
jgi:hypothetical protein